MSFLFLVSVVLFLVCSRCFFFFLPSNHVARQNLRRTERKYLWTDSIKADSYAYEKLIRKWTKSVFFGFFQSYGYENGPDSYAQIRLSFS